MPSVSEIYRGRVVTLVLEEVHLPSGVTAKLEIIRHPGAAAVVPLTEAGEVVLLRQYRHAAGGYLWEIPAGTLRPNEAPETCAARELTEEAGVAAAHLVPLGAVFTSPGFCDEQIHLYLATGLRPAAQRLDRDEVLTVSRIPFDRALEMVADGEIRDAKSIAGLHRAAAHLGRRGGSGNSSRVTDTGEQG